MKWKGRPCQSCRRRCRMLRGKLTRWSLLSAPRWRELWPRLRDRPLRMRWLSLTSRRTPVKAAGTVVAKLARRAADATLRATVALSVSTRTGRSTITYAARACLGVAACHSGHHLPPPSPPHPVCPQHTPRAPLQAPCPWRGKPAAVAVPRKRAPAAFLAQLLQQHPPWWIPRPADWWTPNLNPCPATSTAAIASFIQNKLRNLHHT